MKLAVIIPDRNDRPLFLANCLRMLKKQTLQPDHIELVNYEPNLIGCDITQRYKFGYEKLKNKGFDLIAFIENDDFYAENYLQTMVNGWVNADKPDLFGTNYTIYYHINMFSYFTMYHQERSSMMSTVMKPDLNITWCEENDPFTDAYLWSISTARDGNGYLRGVIFEPKEHICLGIKHGVGMCGGGAHIDLLNRYYQHGKEDKDAEFLQSIMDEESYEFYANYFNK